jgi:hypothetical protein
VHATTKRAWPPSTADHATGARRRAQADTALITIIDREQPPRRFIGAADAISTAEQKVAELQEQVDA